MWRSFIFCLVIAVVGQHVVRILIRMHAFQAVFNHTPGPCRRLSSIGNSSEDATVLPNGILFVSSGFSGRGRLLRVDLESNEEDISEWLIEGNFDTTSFSPHGISVWKHHKSGEVTLFVINHRPMGDAVEVFRHDGSKETRVLQHLSSITHPEITHLNDLVATGPDSFYATVDQTFNGFLEYAMLYRGASVIYYDNGTAKTVITGLLVANGINTSTDKRFLYVCEMGNENLITYRMNQDNSLTQLQVFHVNSAVDNVDVDPVSGDIWIGANPKVILMLRRLIGKGAGHVAPSQVDTRLLAMMQGLGASEEEISFSLPKKQKNNNHSDNDVIVSNKMTTG